MPDYQGESLEVGLNSLDRWGGYVLMEWSKTLIPVHGDTERGMKLWINGLCRCRIQGGQWIYEADACPVCKKLGDEWNSVVRMPAGVDES